MMHPRCQQPRVRSLIPSAARLVCAFTLLALAPMVHARSTPVALTFDDLPGLTLQPDQAYIDRINRDIVNGLRRRGFPAIGFVNAGKIDELDPQRQVANLRRWVNAGLELGNHTFSHESPNTLGAQGYVADIARGEPAIRALLAARRQKLVWFRHPYLETGAPAAVRAQIDGWLRDHGYRVAPVTIDADDWEFAEPYDDAIARHDDAARRRIRAEYLAHTAHAIDWARASARVLFGRNIAHVILLHDTRLNADCLDALAGLLRKRHMRPAPLEQVMRDPAYRTHEAYAGNDGIDWIERWGQALDQELPWDSLEDVPKDIEQAYDRIDPDRAAVATP